MKSTKPKPVRVLLADINDAAADALTALPVQDEVSDAICGMLEGERPMEERRGDIRKYLRGVEEWLNTVAAKLDAITAYADDALDTLHGRSGDNGSAAGVRRLFVAVHGDRSEPEHSRELDALRRAIEDLADDNAD